MLKFLLIIILLFFAFSFFSRLLLGRLFKNFRKNMNQQFYENKEEQKKEGEVTINDTSRSKSKEQGKFKNDQGEYVDYEEIE